MILLRRPERSRMDEGESQRVDRTCQGVSAWDEPCTRPATQHCEQCVSWFCKEHYLDPNWHLCFADH
jgi:hypothetical protein